MAQVPPLLDIEVRYLSAPSPVKPVLVCGLPGSGYVGKLAAYRTQRAKCEYEL